MSERIGFIGLGAMGLGMSRNLLRAGRAVTGFDIDASRHSSFESAGGTFASSAAEAAKGCDILYVCVFSAAEAGPMLEVQGEVVPALNPGALIVMHTTMAPSESVAIAETLASAGHAYLEAPITGGQQGADDGTLTAIVSGPATAVERTRADFEAMCSQVHIVGERAGAALTVKMVNQLLVGTHIATTVEALSLAARAGADPRRTFEVVSNGRGNSTIFSARGPNILAGKPELPRTVEIFLKDLGVVLAAGRELEMALPMCASAHQLFLSAAALAKTGDQEPSLVSLYETLNNIDIAASASPGDE